MICSSASAVIGICRCEKILYRSVANPMLLLVKGHLLDSLDIFWEIFRDTSKQIFTLSLINNIVCISRARFRLWSMKWRCASCGNGARCARYQSHSTDHTNTCHPPPPSTFASVTTFHFCVRPSPIFDNLSMQFSPRLLVEQRPRESFRTPCEVKSSA